MHNMKKDLFSVEENDRHQKVIKDYDESIKICTSSCKLMNFNVEDIMALPMLKEDKLMKNVKRVNIKNSAEEIKAIQSWTAKQKNISIEVKLDGFSSSSPAVEIDEGRF